MGNNNNEIQHGSGGGPGRMPGPGEPHMPAGMRALSGPVYGAQQPVMFVMDQGEDSGQANQDQWRWARTLLRRKGLILGITLLGALAGLAILAPRRPQYTASVSVEIQAANEDFLYGKDVNPTASQTTGFPDFDMATETTVLKTSQLRGLVVAKLKADPTIQIHVPEDRFAKWRKALHLPPRADLSRDEAIAATAATFDAKSAQTTRIVNLSCSSPDPALAAAFVNTMASEYAEQSLEKRWKAARHTGEWLARQLDDMKLKLERSEAEMQDYAAAVSLAQVTGDEKGKTSASGEKLRQLQSELSVAQGDRVAKQARYELVSSRKPDSLGAVLDDPTIRNFDSKLSDLRRELANLSTTLTPAHYKVHQVESQIAELESDRSKFRDRIVEHVYNEFLEAERRERLLADAWQSQSKLVYADAGKLAHYNILEREVDTDRQMYQGLLQKVKEAGISAALRASNIEVIDPAMPPALASSPNLRNGALLGLLAGMLVAFALAFVLDSLNRNLEIPSEVAWHLKLPVLGAIPARKSDSRRWKGPYLVGTGLGRARSKAKEIVAQFRSPEALQMTEAFRAVLTSILFIGKRHRAQVLVVTSPSRAEGKTTVCSNLALAAADANRSVLIVDCDVRLPRLHDLFDVPRDPGLGGLLSEREPLTAEVLMASLAGTAMPGVRVLPSGSAGTSAEHFLHSPRFAELIAIARQHFDMVLIDTPPSLQFADARIAGALADGLVLVVRSGRTQRDTAIAACQQLREDGIPVLGTVLNDWDPQRAGYYGYEYYSNAYDDYAKSAGQRAVS